LGKVTDLKAYWGDLAKKANIPDEKVKAMLEALDDDAVRKAFTDGFKPLPDYSHDLDDVRNRTKAEKDNEYRTWHEQEKAKYDEYVASIDTLQKYKTKFGELDSAEAARFINDQHRGGPMLTKEDIDRFKADALAEMKTQLAADNARRDKTMLDYVEIRESHMGTFKAPLDTAAFEKAWGEHPEWGTTLRSAYKEFVAPEMQKIAEAKLKAESDRRYEEGLRDGFSRRNVPIDSQSRSFSPLFDKDVTIDKMTPAEREQHSRQAFFEGLNEKQTA